MKKDTLGAVLIGLLSIFVVACGDSGADPVEEETGFGEEEGGVVDDVDEDEVVDEHEEEIGDEDPEIEEPFCGDGLVDGDEACDDGNTDDGDGCSSECEEEAFAGVTDGDIQIQLIVDDLNSNEAPLETECADIITLEVSEGLLTGEGTCFLPANFLSYTLDATVDEAGLVSGEIEIVLNNRPNVLAVSGALVDGTLALEFDGVTILIGSIRGVWNGAIQADFE